MDEQVGVDRLRLCSAEMASPTYERQGFGIPKPRQPGARVQHFALAGKRGGAAPALVDYILLAEFDIDSGRWAVCVCVCVAVLVLDGRAFWAP